MGGLLNKKTVLMALALTLIVGYWLIAKQSQKVPGSADQATDQSTQNRSPKIVSTNPANLDGSIVLANQSIQINFNQPLENTAEFRMRIDPQFGYHLDLSQDRQTIKIIPDKPLSLGTTYTLFISVDTKFTGGGRLDGDKIFHFRTIEYKGV